MSGESNWSGWSINTTGMLTVNPIGTPQVPQFFKQYMVEMTKKKRPPTGTVVHGSEESARIALRRSFMALNDSRIDFQRIQERIDRIDELIRKVKEYKDMDTSEETDECSQAEDEEESSKSKGNQTEGNDSDDDSDLSEEDSKLEKLERKKAALLAEMENKKAELLAKFDKILEDKNEMDRNFAKERGLAAPNTSSASDGSSASNAQSVPDGPSTSNAPNAPGPSNTGEPTFNSMWNSFISMLYDK